MDCKNHAGRNGVNTCSKCGEWLCDDCSLEVEGRIVCKKCVARFIDGNDRPASETVRASSTVPIASTSGYRAKPEGRRVISWGLLFIFSFILPGVNYMYMGLIKRGLFVMSAFFLTIYLIANMGISTLGLVIPILWITSIFDGFEVRRRILAGKVVEDGVADIINSLHRFKTPLIVFCFILVGSSFFSSLRSMGSWGHYGRSWRGSSSIFDFIAFVIIAFGVHFLFKAFTKNKKSDTDVVDKRNE